jgi:hypothetical protein
MACHQLQLLTAKPSALSNYLELHSMKVCIERSETGEFSVYQEQENEPAAEGTAPEPAEQQNAQPAPDLKSALMIAAKMLSQSDEAQKQSMFDQGMAKTAPVKGPSPMTAGGM